MSRITIIKGFFSLKFLFYGDFLLRFFVHQLYYFMKITVKSSLFVNCYFFSHRIFGSYE